MNQYNMQRFIMCGINASSFNTYETFCTQNSTCLQTHASTNSLYAGTITWYFMKQLQLPPHHDAFKCLVDNLGKALPLQTKQTVHQLYMLSLLQVSNPVYSMEQA